MAPRYVLGQAEIRALVNDGLTIPEIGLAGFAPCYIPDPPEEPPLSIGKRILAWICVSAMAIGGLAMVAFGVAGLTCVVGLACLTVGG